MSDDFYRGRRLRSSESMRSLVRETVVTSADLIAPLFVVDGKGKRMPVEAMPGVERLSVDYLDREVSLLRKAGISSVLLFGVPDQKDANGSTAWHDEGIIQRAIKAIKKADSEMIVITDICLCGYTDHGHCGHLKNGKVDNDATLISLAKMALSHAQAGSDIVAPSDMMDGRVKKIRQVLNDQGFSQTPILSYAAKYASAFYGPFREAAQSAPSYGDRKSYQMDYSNFRQAMREIQEDIREGADLVMVKPALAYLDVIRAARESIDVPLVAYNVSGEYSMIKAASERGWVNEAAIVKEILTAIKRAGADRIITYYAKEFRSLTT